MMNIGVLGHRKEMVMKKRENNPQFQTHENIPVQILPTNASPQLMNRTNNFRD